MRILCALVELKYHVEPKLFYEISRTCCVTTIHVFQNLLSLIPSGRPDTLASVLMLEVGRWCLMKELVYKPFEKFASYLKQKSILV